MSLAARITEARQRRGLSQQALGNLLGISRAAVAQWENGQTKPAAERLIDLADKLGAPFEWLYWGREQAGGGATKAAPEGYVWVSLLSAGEATKSPVTEGAQLLPQALIERDLGGAADDFALVTMVGQAMEPLLPHGSTLLVDRRHTSPSPPGIFAISDGANITVQWVQQVPASPRLRLSSENSRFASQEVEASAITILGRAVWCARRL